MQLNEMNKKKRSSVKYHNTMLAQIVQIPGPQTNMDDPTAHNSLTKLHAHGRIILKVCTYTNQSNVAYKKEKIFYRRIRVLRALSPQLDISKKIRNQRSLLSIHVNIEHHTYHSANHTAVINALQGIHGPSGPSRCRSEIISAALRAVNFPPNYTRRKAYSDPEPTISNGILEYHQRHHIYDQFRLCRLKVVLQCTSVAIIPAWIIIMK